MLTVPWSGESFSRYSCTHNSAFSQCREKPCSDTLLSRSLSLSHTHTHTHTHPPTTTTPKHPHNTQPRYLFLFHVVCVLGLGDSTIDLASRCCCVYTVEPGFS